MGAEGASVGTLIVGGITSQCRRVICSVRGLVARCSTFDWKVGDSPTSWFLDSKLITRKIEPGRYRSRFRI